MCRSSNKQSCEKKRNREREKEVRITHPSSVNIGGGGGGGGGAGAGGLSRLAVKPCLYPHSLLHNSLSF